MLAQCRMRLAAARRARGGRDDSAYGEAGPGIVARAPARTLCYRLALARSFSAILPHGARLRLHLRRAKCTEKHAVSAWCSRFGHDANALFALPAKRG